MQETAVEVEQPALTLEKPKTNKFDPDPETRSNKIKEIEELAEDALRGKVDKYMDIGSGFKIAHKPGSAHSLVIRLLAREGKFDDVVRTLNDPAFDPSDKNQALSLVARMMVPRETIEDLATSDRTWKKHSLRKFLNLVRRSQAGDSKAERVLANVNRVANGKWVGNIREIICTCCGSYTKCNRNVRKFHNAGVVFRQFPVRPKGKDPIFVMMFPAAFKEQVSLAIQTSLGALDPVPIIPFQAKEAVK